MNRADRRASKFGHFTAKRQDHQYLVDAEKQVGASNIFMSGEIFHSRDEHTRRYLEEARSVLTEREVQALRDAMDKADAREVECLDLWYFTH